MIGIVSEGPTDYLVLKTAIDKYPVDDAETVLLIDSWENQEAIDVHHKNSNDGYNFEVKRKT